MQKRSCRADDISVFQLLFGPNRGRNRPSLERRRSLVARWQQFKVRLLEAESKMAERLGHLRNERIILRATDPTLWVKIIASEVCDIDLYLLSVPGRGKKKVARVRDLAMSLALVFHCGKPAVIARWFNRECRTTVIKANTKVAKLVRRPGWWQTKHSECRVEIKKFLRSVDRDARGSFFRKISDGQGHN